jgi:hypothetical protein
MIVKIQGGLGNQMFQYAFAKSLSLKNKKAVFLDNTAFDSNSFITKRDFKLEIFNISLSLVSQNNQFVNRKFKNHQFFNKLQKKVIKKWPFLSKKIRIEKSLEFDNKNLNLYSYYEGYWQSEKYFKDFNIQIINDFAFKNINILERGIYVNDILSTNAVSIHVRRGDYVNNPVVNNFHGSLSTDYYEKAIKLVMDKVENPVFYVFSDDINWVQLNMFKTDDINLIFVITSSEEEDLFLMSKCKHNIIANSSFSWWGAYLNEYINKIIVAPKIWYKNIEANKSTIDLIPSKWIRI